MKLAPLVLALRARPDTVPIVVASGQHPQMAREALQVFGIDPDRELNLGASQASLPTLVARVLAEANELLAELRPSRVIVQGDTATTFGAALAAFHQRIPLGHVEAGLRTGDLAAPFPEEAYRQMVSRLAEFHFAPTESASQNLLREGVPESRIWVTGNTVVDALNYVIESGALQRADLPVELQSIEGRILLATGHRRENFDGGIARICDALLRILRLFPDITVVWPVHPNPKAQSPVRKMLSGEPRVILCPPLSYVSFLSVLRRASLVVSDSGGIQEEAPSFGVPVVVTREHTERIEGLATNQIVLAGTDPDQLVAACSAGLSRARSTVASNPYGDGFASIRIAELIS